MPCNPPATDRLRHAARIAQLAAILALAGTASANYGTTVEFIGFSEDGSLFAWEQFGVQDGSGFPHSEIVIQEVDGGMIVERFSILLEDEFRDLDDARALCRSDAAGSLHALSENGWLQGVHCIHHPPTDLTAAGDSVRFSSFVPAPGYSIGDRTLTLLTEPVPGTEMEEFWGFAPVLLEVVVRDNSTGETLVIARDEDLDPARSYCFGYGIEGVWALGDSAFAASIGASSIGFEGPDLSYLFMGWVR